MQTTTTTTTPTKTEWRKTFAAALVRAMTRAGVTESVQFETCTTDQTWGDRVGLVFFGASAATNERAAKYFESWARKHLRALGAVGNYASQESIAFEGSFEFSRYANGAQGWHRVRPLKDWEIAHAAAHPPVERREGVATSYVYYPGAE